MKKDLRLSPRIRGASGRAGLLLASTALCVSFVGTPRLVQAEDLLPAAAPAPAVRQGWQYSIVGRTAVTYTDNAYLTPNNRTDSLVFTPNVILGAQETGRRSIFDANLNVAYDFYTRASDLDGPRITGIADGRTELVEDAVSIRARAGTNLESTSQLGGVTASERTLGGNQVQLVTYGVGPSFRQALTQTINADASYDFSGVSFLSAPTGSTRAPASDSFLHKAQLGVSNGGANAPFEWDVRGTYQNQTHTNATPSSERANGEVSGQYHLTQIFSVLVTGGYDWIREPTLVKGASGPYGTAGFLWQPSPRTSLRLEAGYRNQKPNYSGELKYRYSEALVVVANYSQGVDTTQGALDSSFARLVRDPSGILIDPLTGLPATPGSTNFDLTDQAFRYSRLSVGLQGVVGRNFYNASGNYERRNANGVIGKDWGGSASIGRNLTRALTMTIEAQYTKTTSPTLVVQPKSYAETAIATGTLSYRLNETLTASLKYIYLHHLSSVVKYREHAGVFAIEKHF
jgi:uncharacterized protein (PEP-CTERM system associated)